MLRLLFSPKMSTKVAHIRGLRRHFSGSSVPEWKGDLSKLFPDEEFCVGGSVTVGSDDLSIFTSNGKLSFPQQPGASDGFEKLKSLCRPAPFGRGTETVLDPTYRNALELTPSEFATTLNLAELGILSEIQKTLAPSEQPVFDKVSKLNIYSVGDFFNPHVDTPRGKGFFGSLVVCLPGPNFKGGELQVRHKGQEQMFDWGSTSGGDPKVSWAALFSDCEHDIKPVTSGIARVTLAYSLFTSPFKIPELSLHGHPFYQKMSAMLDDQGFFPGGGTLLFASRHQYNLENLRGEGPGYPASVLKGRDSIICQIAELLGITVTFQPIFGGYEVAEFDLDSDDPVRFWTAEKFPENPIWEGTNDDGCDTKDVLKDEFKAFPLVENDQLLWCGDAKTVFPTKVGGTVYVGNDCGSGNDMYVCGTLFLRIPEVAKRKGAPQVQQN